MQLTSVEIDILIEAVETWERKHSDAGVGAAMMGLMLGAGKRSEDDSKSFFVSAVEEGKSKDAANKDMAILIKAKLIQMKRDAQSATDTAYDRETSERRIR